MNRTRLKPVKMEVNRIRKAMESVGKNEFIAFIDKGVLTAFSCFRKTGKHQYVEVKQNVPENDPEAFLEYSGMKGIVICGESELKD